MLLFHVKLTAVQKVFGSLRSVKVLAKYQFARPTYLGTELTLYSGRRNRAYIYINHKQQLKPTSVSIWIHRVCEVSLSTEFCRFRLSQSYIVSLSASSLEYSPSYMLNFY